MLSSITGRWDMEGPSQPTFIESRFNGLRMLGHTLQKKTKEKNNIFRMVCSSTVSIPFKLINYRFPFVSNARIFREWQFILKKKGVENSLSYFLGKKRQIYLNVESKICPPHTHTHFGLQLLKRKVIIVLINKYNLAYVCSHIITLR